MESTCRRRNSKRHSWEQLTANTTCSKLSRVPSRRLRWCMRRKLSALSKAYVAQPPSAVLRSEAPQGFSPGLLLFSEDLCELRNCCRDSKRRANRAASWNHEPGNPAGALEEIGCENEQR